PQRPGYLTVPRDPHDTVVTREKEEKTRAEKRKRKKKSFSSCQRSCVPSPRDQCNTIACRKTLEKYGAVPLRISAFYLGDRNNAENCTEKRYREAPKIMQWEPPFQKNSGPGPLRSTQLSFQEKCADLQKQVIAPFLSL
ncbi:hypothetical protein K0M31_010753, partial [Melipona bicolor]